MQRLLTNYIGGEPPSRRPRLELNALRLPKASEKSIREGKFVVRRVPQSTVTRFEEMLLSANGDATTMNRLWKLFNEFETLNVDITKNDRDVALALFLVDVLEQGLKASSVVTYARTIIEASGRADAGTSIKGIVTVDILKSLNIIDAKDDVDHAPDISEETGWKVVMQLSGSARVTAAVSQLIPELRSIVAAPSKSPLPVLDCSAFNQALRSVPEAEMLKLTSYSFRRLFIQSVISGSTKGDVTDWLAASKQTGHLSLEVLRTKYTVKFQNTL